MAKTITLYVRDLETREIIHSLEVENATGRKVEKVLAGLLMRVDTDRFFVDDSEADELFEEDQP